MKNTVLFVLFAGAVSAGSLNIRSQVASVRDLMTAQDYSGAATSLAKLRRSVATTSTVPMDFSATRTFATATPSQVVTFLDDALQKSYANDVAGTVHALDGAQILAAGLDRNLPSAQRLSEQRAKAALNPDPMTLVGAERAAYEAGDYAAALDYSHRFFATSPNMRGSQMEHWAHSLAGLSYHRLADGQNALAELTASGSVAGIGTFLPDLSLAQALAAQFPKAVSEYLDAAVRRNPKWNQKDLVPNWKAALARGQVPDFGPVPTP